MPVTSSAEAATAHARHAASSTHFGKDDPRTVAAKQHYAEIALRDRIRAALPNLTPDARARLALEFLGD